MKLIDATHLNLITRKGVGVSWVWAITDGVSWSRADKVYAV